MGELPEFDDFDLGATGRLAFWELEWRDSGGPAIAAQTHRGFWAFVGRPGCI